jgi:arginyl-tRNA synthetase
MLAAKSLKKTIADLVRGKYSLSLDVPIEFPPRLEFGDLATPIAFEIAKRMKKKPIAIAQELASEIQKGEGIEKIEVAGKGYINIFFDKTTFVKSLYQELSQAFQPDLEIKTKIIVEHTNINPNKAAHIGHLRNAVLGDTLCRVLTSLGYPVEIQNYIDDTGVQVADIVIGFQKLLQHSLKDIQQTQDKFDYFCWDLYAKVTSYYEGVPKSQKESTRSETLKLIEEGNNPTAEMASYVAQRIVKQHLNTMDRIGVRYNLLVWESHILAMKFWEKAFVLLKSRQAIQYAEEGESKGCWVMNLPILSDAEVVDETEKIIVRSNGTATYVGKDIAYQLWKFGLLGEDFHYESFRPYSDETDLWTTAREPRKKSARAFGKGSRVYNVIDVRQTYPQQIVKESLKLLGFTGEAERSAHFGYEMVALSPKCALDLGFDISDEEKNKPYIEISGRRGQGVKADDLLDKLYEKALHEVRKRNPEADEEDVEKIARTVAAGSLRYFMLKFSRNKIITFDFEDALNFDGETGPYVQYAAVRSRNIFNRMKEREGFREEDIPEIAADIDFGILADRESLEHWELVSLIARLPDMLEQSVLTLELSSIAKYSFHLAQTFNTFYQKYQVMNEKDPLRKNLRIIITYLFRRQLTRALHLMGIEIPVRM